MPATEHFQKMLGIQADQDPASQLAERGVDRYEMSSIPAQGKQKNWGYSLTQSGESGHALHLDSGNGRTFSFQFNGDIGGDEFRQGGVIPLMRVGDSTRHGDRSPSGSVVSKGILQVHKSTPGMIYATLQNGRGNATVLLEQAGDRWQMKLAPPKKRLSEAAAKFVGGLSKQAAVCCPECGESPSKYKIQGDAISCGQCGKTSDMERWDKSASNAAGDLVYAVDLDGTLAHHEGEFDHKVVGEPIKPMMRLVRLWIRKGHEVRIFTARASDPKNIPPIKAWLKEHGLGDLKVTNRKDPDVSFVVDDRAVGVVRNTGKLRLDKPIKGFIDDANEKKSRTPRNDKNANLPELAAHEGSLQQSPESVLSTIRRARNPSLRKLAEQFYKFSRGHGREASGDDLGQKIGQRELLSRKLSLGDGGAAGQQQAESRPHHGGRRDQDDVSVGSSNGGESDLHQKKVAHWIIPGGCGISSRWVWSRKEGCFDRIQQPKDGVGGLGRPVANSVELSKQAHRVLWVDDREGIHDPSKQKQVEQFQKEGSNSFYRPLQGAGGLVFGHQKAAVIPQSYLKILRDKFIAARKNVNLTPTKPQQESGLYRKGHVWAQGLDLVIENPKGGVRSGTSKSGKKWSVVMKNDYGYIRRFKNKKGDWVSCRAKSDGDHIDMFMGPHPSSEAVFVIDQNDPLTGLFDEAKVMLGFTNTKDAKDAYFKNFSDEWKGFRSITHVTIDELCHWIEHGDTGRPYSTPKTWKAANARVSDLAANEGAMLQPQKQGVQVVWGAGDQGVRPMVSQLSILLERYVPKTAGHDARKEGQQSGLLQRELLLGHSDRAESKSAEQHPLRVSGQKDAASRVGSSDWNPQGNPQNAPVQFGVDTRKSGDHTNRSSQENFKNADTSGGHTTDGLNGQAPGNKGGQVQICDPAWIVRGADSVQKYASAPSLTGEIVFVFDEFSGNEFSGHKFIAGCHTTKEARETYALACGGQKLGDITALTIRQLKSWLKNGDTSKAIAGQDISEHIKKAMLECEEMEKQAVDNSYLPPMLANIADSRWVRDPGMAMGSGAIRGALIASVIHGARTLKREGLDEPKKDLNLTRDLAFGTALGAGSGLLLHYVPEIMESAHNTFGVPKHGHAMDVVLAPLHVGGKFAPILGAGYGAIVGAAKGLGGKLKRKITGEPEEEGQFEADVFDAAQQGLNIGTMASLSGMNPASVKAFNAMPPSAAQKKQQPRPLLKNTKSLVTPRARR